MRIFKLTTFFVFAIILARCESGNVLSDAEDLNGDEQVIVYVEKEQYENAIDTLETLINEDPEGYQRYPLLSSLYALLGGVDLINMVQLRPSGDADIFSQLNGFLPTSPTAAQVDYLKKAKELLSAMPEEFRTASETIKYVLAPSCN